jgi:peptidylprolyl isomerase
MIKNRLIFQLILIILFSIISNCKKETIAKTSKKTTKTTKKKTAKIVKPFDSINHTNAVDFLIAYGKAHKSNKVRFKTRLGSFTVLLYDDTPLHRANFIFLANAGYFDTTCFHRVVPDFIVQGGNSESGNTLGFRNKYENYTIPPEFRKHHRHKYGALAAAREWENNISKKSTPFEFYFIQSKNGAHHINGEHTVFGEIISGFDTLNKIALVKTGRDEWPLKDVFMDIIVLN